MSLDFPTVCFYNPPALKKRYFLILKIMAGVEDKLSGTAVTTVTALNLANVADLAGVREAVLGAPDRNIKALRDAIAKACGISIDSVEKLLARPELVRQLVDVHDELKRITTIVSTALNRFNATKLEVDPDDESGMPKFTPENVDLVRTEVQKVILALYAAGDPASSATLSQLVERLERLEVFFSPHIGDNPKTTATEIMVILSEVMHALTTSVSIGHSVERGTLLEQFLDLDSVLAEAGGELTRSATMDTEADPGIEFLFLQATHSAVQFLLRTFIILNKVYKPQLHELLRTLNPGVLKKMRADFSRELREVEANITKTRGAAPNRRDLAPQEQNKLAALQADFIGLRDLVGSLSEILELVQSSDSPDKIKFLSSPEGK